MNTALAEKDRETTTENEEFIDGGFLTVSQVAEYLSIGKSLVYALMERGELRYCKFGKARRIPKKEVVRYASKKLTRPQSDNMAIPLGTTDTL